MSNENLIYQLKITIKDTKPPVWRRILLPANATFWELHIAIQDSFGWIDYHLHEFFIGTAWDRNATSIALPNPENDILGEEKKPVDESKAILSDYLSKDRTWITYVYDFGDNWEHRIVLEKVLPADKKVDYPQVIAGKRACPWEDSGGPWGYLDKIEILKNKNHEEFRYIADWLDINDFEELDLESFDPGEIIFRNPATELQRVLQGFAEEYGISVEELNGKLS